MIGNKSRTGKTRVVRVNLGDLVLEIAIPAGTPKPITHCNARQTVTLGVIRDIRAASSNALVESISMRRNNISAREISVTVDFISRSIGVSIVSSTPSTGRARDGNRIREDSSTRGNNG